MERREIGRTGIPISPVTLGCWPMAGMTSPGATDANSIATIHRAIELGINHLDTAFGYGRNGESEQLVGRALVGRRDKVVLATKGGMHWNDASQAVFDSSPERLRQQLETSLQRLQTDYVDLYYVHHPDLTRPLEETAELVNQFRQEGKIRAVGVSNFSLDQLQRFHAVCPLDAFQAAYSMLERGIEADRLPWCRERQISVHVYWALVKGLLAGKMRGDETFENDSRKRYPMFQGEEYRLNLALVERLRTIASESNRTVAQLVVRWTIEQPGITTVLCGAKRPEQIEETAGAMGWSLMESQKNAVEQALRERGEPSRCGPFGKRA